MTCPGLNAGGPSAIADALSAVDCLSAQTTAAAFSRLFGGEGMLTMVLTMALTLYVGIFALGLLTGRSSLGISSLTPRMMGLGLVLTFATSWVAYSQVIWNLLAGGPDWIASLLLGIKGSASQAFAQRLDEVFMQIANAAEAAQQQAAGDKKGTTPGDLLSYAALLLLLGTVGVLVTCRIALAALLAVGPVFLVLALFNGTRGLFEGWVKTAVMFALAPMFATLIGAGSVAMLGPVAASLEGGDVSIHEAATVFVAAAVHCALMAMALKLVSSLTSGWRIGFAKPGPHTGNRTDQTADPKMLHQTGTGPIAAAGNSAAPIIRDDRIRAVVAATSQPHGEGAAAASARIINLPGVAIQGASPAFAAPAPADSRLRDIARNPRRKAAASIKESL
ncbi:MAG: type IV secretion system protein [Proteobacteria bacterium]|nr:type IV secretion system protein [Pseudomonadota bacterium]